MDPPACAEVAVFAAPSACGWAAVSVVLSAGVGGAAFYAGFAFQPKQEERDPPRAEGPGEKPGPPVEKSVPKKKGLTEKPPVEKPK